MKIFTTKIKKITAKVWLRRNFCSSIDIFDFEDTIAIFLWSCSEFQGKRQSLAAEENVHNTGVLDAWEALLLIDIVCNILQVALDLEQNNKIKAAERLGVDVRTVQQYVKKKF